jgi:hypothetical protein
VLPGSVLMIQLFSEGISAPATWIIQLLTTSRIAIYKECRYLETSERQVKPAAGFTVFIKLPSHSFPLNLLAAIKEL